MQAKTEIQGLLDQNEVLWKVSFVEPIDGGESLGDWSPGKPGGVQSLEAAKQKCAATPGCVAFSWQEGEKGLCLPRCAISRTYEWIPPMNSKIQFHYKAQATHTPTLSPAKPPRKPHWWILIVLLVLMIVLLVFGVVVLFHSQDYSQEERPALQPQLALATTTAVPAEEERPALQPQLTVATTTALPVEERPALQPQLTLATTTALPTEERPVPQPRLRPATTTGPPAEEIKINVAVVPYGVLDRAPNEQTAIVDPAGLWFIWNNRPDEAGGASGAIYHRLGIAYRGAFSEDVRSITEISEAKSKFYKGYFDVIHVAPPKLAEVQSELEACKKLVDSYKNVFREFASGVTEHNLTELRLLPISGGIFAGRFINFMQTMTATAVDQALSDLKGDPWTDMVFKLTTINMCIFKAEQHDDYKRAFARRGDQGHCHRQPSTTTTSTPAETTTKQNEPDFQGNELDFQAHEPDFQAHEPDFHSQEPDFHSHEPDFSGTGH